jgi:hypothetical protein
MEKAALTISLCALAFTLFSFWWLNWRKGKIIVGSPRSFAAVSNGENDLLMVQLPLIFYNDGAAVRIVQNLRLTLKQNGVSSEILYFNNTISDLASDNEKKWASQFVVRKRSYHSSIFVFMRNPGHFTFSQGKCRAIVEAKLYDSKNWQEILDFKLHIPAQSVELMNRGTLLPYDNDPDREYSH